MTDKTFYITTPIYYPSGKLHLGSSYTTIACDVLARYKRLMGLDTMYLTGLDEHGLKIQRKAEEAGFTPQEYLDGMAVGVKELWETLDISYDVFMRTSYDFHAAACQKAFEELLLKDDIYLGKYAGWYSVSDEEYFTESQLKVVFRDEKGKVTGGVAPSDHEVEWVEEECYFFRMGKYVDWLLHYYDTHPDFIEPEVRKNEMINNFIKPGLEDLALTRTSFTWGVPVKSNPKHVMYVWFDALLNYITALGYNSADDSKFKKYWPGINMVGKEIVRFHTIYWPIMLHALGIEPPKQVFGHGWLLMKDGKMSKSKGNVVYPEMLVERYGLDPVRYYLMREVSFGQDGIFTPEDFISRINYDLANDLGNLLNRTIAMVNQYKKGKVTRTSALMGVDDDLEKTLSDTLVTYHEAMDKFQFNVALGGVWNFIARTNKYIDETAPWLLAKDKSKTAELDDVLYHLVENLRIVASLLQPFIHTTSEKIFAQLGLTEKKFDLSALTFGYSFVNPVVEKGQPIFPRLEAKDEVAYIQAQMGKQSTESSVSPVKVTKGRETELATSESATVSATPLEKEIPADSKAQIAFEDFEKLELKVAEVLSVKKVEGSTKLLLFQLDAGEEVPRTILSGIAKYYPDEQVLVGKKLQIVANLKPRQMMKKYVSQGMILSAESAEGKVWVCEVAATVPNGSLIG